MHWGVVHKIKILQSSERIQKFQPLSVLRDAFPERWRKIKIFADLELLQSGDEGEG